MKHPSHRIVPRTRALLLILAAVALVSAAGCSRENPLPIAPRFSASGVSKLMPASRPVAVNAQAVGRAREAKDRYWAQLKSAPGVFGMGISWTETGTVFIGVSIDKNRVGPVTSIPTEFEEIPVRVFMEAPPALFAKPPPPPPPPLIFMGTSTVYGDYVCQTQVTDGGTLGCVVRSGNTKYFLSCAHVFSPQGGTGQTVVDPIPRLPNCTTQVVGTVTHVAPVFPGGSFTIDAALAKVAKNLNYTTAMFSGYTPTTTVTDAMVGLAVKKTGMATGLRSGTVTMIHYDFHAMADYGGLWDYLDQIKIETADFAHSGDSGALVVTEAENNPVGMVVGGDPTSAHSFAVATPIQRILNQFGMTMAP